MRSSNLLILCLIGVTFGQSFLQGRSQWTVEQANQWWQGKWFVGSNFIPSTAVNTLEMWQAETYDSATIDRELGYASAAGLTVMRVFLHHLVWQQDPTGFLARVDNYLSIASKHGIKTMLVMFDDCWNPEAKLGPQPEPRKGVHNSQWVQAPGEKLFDDVSQYPLFEQYFTSVIGHFKNDDRVFVWDIYNEPGNNNHAGRTLPLLKKSFEWARNANPSQPITAGLWNWSDAHKELNAYQTQESDVVTFHIYQDAQGTINSINGMKSTTQRPIICTEYMARPFGSKFQSHVPIFNDANIGAINWGLVSGRTNTIYAWGSPEGSEEPAVWFHDIFRKDGTPFDQEEIEVLKKYGRPTSVIA